MIFELLEVVDEHGDQRLGLLVVGVSIGPGAARVEQLVVHAGDGDRYFEAEIRIDTHLGAQQAAVQRRVEQGAGFLDRHAMADTIDAASPACVDQPAIHIMLVDQGTEQIAVLAGVARHEGRTEAGGEGGFRLGHALFGARHLGGVAGQEVIHGLARGEPGDGRQHTEGVSRQHDDGVGLARNAGEAGIGDVADGIGAAGVLGQRRVVEVELAGLLVHHHVFEHGGETAGGGEDFRLRLRRQLDHLGVAAAFEVEQAVGAPAVLVVTDELAVRVGGECRLAGAGEAEENGGVVLLADIHRAVHRHDLLRRQLVVEHGEDRLLHFARIGRAGNQHDLAGEVAGDHGLGAAAVTGRIGLEARQVDDGEFRREVLKLVHHRLDEQVLDEQRMPGIFGDHAGRQAVILVGAAEQVLDEQLHALGVGQHVCVQGVELLGGHGLVGVPPDLILGRCVTDDELVLGGAAGVGAGLDDEGAVGSELAFTALQRDLDQGRRAVVPMGCLDVGEAHLVEAVARCFGTGLCHCRCLRYRPRAGPGGTTSPPDARSSNLSKTGPLRVRRPSCRRNRLAAAA